MIRFENVGLRYGFGPEVLRDLSFHIDSHSFQFLTGPSGAGKTTLLRLLFLTLKPTRGLISMFNQDTATLTKDDRATLRRRIGIVFQDFRLLDHLTTYENVALPFRVLGKEEAAYRNEVIELLQWVGLGERMDSLPPVLSGGEKQRAAIARAVIARPQLLLADEPTGNVDPNLGQRLLRLFIELYRLGTSVVIATHDIALMDEYDARRLVLHEGRLHVYERASRGRGAIVGRAGPRVGRRRAPRGDSHRAERLDRRPVAERSRCHYDFSGGVGDRHGNAGRRRGERLAVGCGTRSHDTSSAGSRA